MLLKKNKIIAYKETLKFDLGLALITEQAPEIIFENFQMTALALRAAAQFSSAS